MSMSTPVGTVVPGQHEPSCNEHCDGDSHQLREAMMSDGVLSGLATENTLYDVKEALSEGVPVVRMDVLREALLAELDRLQRMDDASVIPLTFVDALMAMRRWAGGDDD